ncbi:histidine phosphatase family protein [Litorilinea aerophila]|uniref:Histidine phosphatase family protein n=1 Tax=Litorilinea aerophila TaxID=1204385 RepID=A0A540VIQ0_9CHLR|nr:histidine phosphatase family protein [Litorilinea aerophila]MCC9075821.1 histidine phosphatase family protein [Litorilinea aerophila]OUC05603.1 hypothetical protein RY27_26285 [Litorilinea aerophila]GIV77250.1 MAG: phosphoglycerate mutase [Litorilinea sp.]GIV80518.1 MAG: phosphoglycerate mutase [Litorilinea sp.]
MKLFLIRHAESANNRLALDLGYDEYMAQRYIDPPLTELGRRQAQMVAQHLADNQHPERPSEQSAAPERSGYGITHLYCSAMLRSLETAAPIGQALGLRPAIWIDIHEHGGMFRGNPRTGEGLEVAPGLNRRQIQEQFPDVLIPDEVTDEGWWFQGYEDMPACYGRATRVARDLRRRAQELSNNEVEESVALVSHGTFIDSLIKALFNQIPAREFYYQHYNTAITRIDFMPDGVLLIRYINRIQHLPPDMVSR